MGVLDFFNQHSDEVFRKRDVVKQFKGKANPHTIRVHIHNLYNAGLIDRYPVAGISHYGSKDAIKKLKQALES